MIFNCISIGLHKKKKQIYISIIVLFITVPQPIFYIISFFSLPRFLTFYFFVNTEVGIKFRLSFIGCYS